MSLSYHVQSLGFHPENPSPELPREKKEREEKGGEGRGGKGREEGRGGGRGGEGRGGKERRGVVSKKFELKQNTKATEHFGSRIRISVFRHGPPISVRYKWRGAHNKNESC